MVCESLIDGAHRSVHCGVNWVHRSVDQREDSGWSTVRQVHGHLTRLVAYVAARANAASGGGEPG